MESIKTRTAKLLNDVETRAMYEKYGISDYPEEVIDLVRQGKHFGIDCFYNKRLDIRYLGNMHNRKRGINNTRHGVMKGGIRRHEKDENELKLSSMV